MSTEIFDQPNGMQVVFTAPPEEYVTQLREEVAQARAAWLNAPSDGEAECQGELTSAELYDAYTDALENLAGMRVRCKPQKMGHPSDLLRQAESIGATHAKIDLDMGEVTMTISEALEAYTHMAPGEGFEVLAVYFKDEDMED